MKTSEVVFELVLIPPTDEFAKVVIPHAKGMSLNEISNKDSNEYLKTDFAGDVPWSDALVRTKVRIRTAEHLLWVVRAADIKLWGLVGKSRYVLYHAASGSFFPLFEKVEVPNGTRSWRINRELVRIFTEESPNESRQKRGYRQRLKKPSRAGLELSRPENLVPLHVEDSWFLSKRKSQQTLALNQCGVLFGDQFDTDR